MATAAPSFLGTSRNLTDKFLRFRNQAKDTGGFGYSASREDLAREKASARLLDAAIGSSSGGASDGALGGIAGMSSTLPPAWVDFSEEASADIAAIKDKLRELSSAHAKALLPTFDDVGGAEDHVVEVVTNEITRLFKRCEGRLRRLGERAADGADAEETRVVKNVQTKLATEAHRLSVVFRKTQKEYLQRLQQQEGRGPGGRAWTTYFRTRATRTRRATATRGSRRSRCGGWTAWRRIRTSATGRWCTSCRA
jgi:syntaxin 16